jgi:hypothetical protein
LRQRPEYFLATITNPACHMTQLLLLDAVGMPNKDFHEAVLWIMMTPFIFSLVIIVFFRLLDKHSSKAIQKND